ncbi:MAG: replication initiation protein [Janthinobacterium lividum]
MSRAQALTRRYLEHSPRALQGMVVVDVDHPDALLRALSRPLRHPEPSWVAETPASGRGHVGWVLQSPVCRTDAARLAPMQLLARIEDGCRRSLGGDVGYTGLLTKNPTHPSWATTWARGEPYNLTELAKHLDDHLPGGLPTLPRRARECSGVGRNVYLFDELRAWAYSAWRRYDDITEWREVTHAQALNLNAEFPVPLGAGEAGQLAKSVAGWVWRNFSDDRFRASQTRRGRKGGSANTPAQKAARAAESRRRTKVDKVEVLKEARGGR